MTSDSDAARQGGDAKAAPVPKHPQARAVRHRPTPVMKDRAMSGEREMLDDDVVTRVTRWIEKEKASVAERGPGHSLIAISMKVADIEALLGLCSKAGGEG